MLKEKLLNSDMHSDLKRAICYCSDDLEVLDILQSIFNKNTALIILYYLNIITDEEYIKLLTQDIKTWR